MEHAPPWLVNSFVYLAASVLAVTLSRTIGLGAIIGYLVAGIAIGPWGLGLIANVQDILHFAEFGVVLMMFLVGLELQPRRLWSLRRPIFGWGSAQVLMCALAITGAALALGVAWRTALVAGLGLALSSTAIALQVLDERNLMHTSSGQAGFSILLFQDVAAIPILAALPLLAGSSGLHEAAVAGPRWLEALKTVAAIAAIVFGGRLLLRPALRWIARSGSTELFTAAALLLVVSMAGLMQGVGLSMALGAFLAGVLLAESEYRRELETDIEPFKGLLMGLFFVAVGMSIDFGVLLASPWLMLGVLLGFLALKLLVIAALARLLRLPLQERPVFTLLLAQGGEFAFVVFRAAADVNALPADVASLLIGAVALSMLLTPLALVAVDRWLLPRYADCGRAPAPPELSEPQSAPVIIAGFGRYGQIVSRLLSAEGVAVTVLDHDAEMIEAARVFGSRVFYGDATRLDLLRIAGAAEARILVVAVDDVEQSLAIVDLARQHFPQLELVARARDVTHWNQLRDRGVMRVQRELFESSLLSGRSVLELLGASTDAARFSADRFRRYNLALFEQMHPYYKDRAKLISVVMRGRMQFEEQLAQEREQAANAAAANALPPVAPGDAAKRD
ncbi:MAG: glutathione-regulated potassium-efflux system protein KefC [Proteobacteria bacterium]|uniref:glutathione-regulated potassium-efflux system protein KefC n=1 Tax=Ottowia sp. TaxID=1898956 RepID=UPI0025D7210F|nr:glutathione-regulated potassium-efflux system protein KefC [Ottowia sp.]MBS0413320.1 glutathione-regulated potassium-efflux system protein KefC [Pseudomonadota bacterium]